MDTAGNVSDTVSSLKKYRKNTPPIVNIDSLINAFEDIEYRVPVVVIDPDTATKLYDRFWYYGYIKEDGIDEWTSWDLIPDTLFDASDPVINEDTGLITFTPLKRDTGNYVMRISVKDSADLWGEINYTMKVLPINDPPIFRSGPDWIDTYPEIMGDSLAIPDITIEEDQAESLRVDMTQYIYDEDNDDTTDITWSGVWHEQGVNAGYLYPRTSLFFGPGTPEIFKERLRAQYLPQRNTALSEHQFQSELKTVGNRTSYKSIAEKDIVFHNTPDGDYAMIKGSPDYYGQNDTIIFYAIDMLTRPASSLFDTFGFDSVAVFITVNAVNDKPYWADTSKFGIDGTAPILADTMMMMENDTLPLPLYSYARDIDNDWLNFTIEVTTHDANNEPDPIDRMTTIPKENAERQSDGDSTDLVKFIPDTTWTGIAKIRATATDSALLDSSTEFYIEVLRVPRPKIVVDVIQIIFLTPILIS